MDKYYVLYRLLAPAGDPRNVRRAGPYSFEEVAYHLHDIGTYDNVEILGTEKADA